MALRFLELRLPGPMHEEVHDIAEGHQLIDSWHVPAGEQEIHRFLMEAQHVEGLVDALRSRFGDEVRIVIMPVEATMPRGIGDVTSDPELETPDPTDTKAPATRVSREELYEDIGERITLSPVFLALAGLSAVVAALGLMRDDQVAIIGAMVIAPLLGPNVGLALATTLGDLPLGKRALKSGLAGIGLSLAVAVAMGWLIPFEVGHEIEARLEPDFGHLALAIASGIAGGLAFTTGVPASLIGVMVAVALLPPLAAGGLLLGSGQVDRSIGAFFLLGINLVAVNLAGVGTFLAQGIRPVFASEKEKAGRAARRAMVVWGLLLLALVAGILRIGGGI